MFSEGKKVSRGKKKIMDMNSKKLDAYFLFKVIKRRKRATIWQSCIGFSQFIKEGMGACFQLDKRSSWERAEKKQRNFALLCMYQNDQGFHNYKFPDPIIIQFKF